jgi:hypothetical protein
MEATVRASTAQFIDTSKVPIKRLLIKALGVKSKAQREKLEAFLDSDLGSALIGSMVAVGLTGLAEVDEHGNPTNTVGMLAKEARISSIATIEKQVLSLFSKPLENFMENVLMDDNTGKLVEQVRVATETVEKTANGAKALGALDAEEEEEEEVEKKGSNTNGMRAQVGAAQRS